MPGEQEGSDSGNTRRSQGLAQLVGSVPREIEQAQTLQQGDETGAPDIHYSRRESGMSVVMANLNFNKMQVNDEVTVEALLSTWPLIPPELERSAAALENTISEQCLRLEQSMLQKCGCG